MNIAGLTTHTRAELRCTVVKHDQSQCRFGTNERCAACDKPICNHHTHRHYQLAHPRLI